MIFYDIDRQAQSINEWQAQHLKNLRQVTWQAQYINEWQAQYLGAATNLATCSIKMSCKRMLQTSMHVHPQMGWAIIIPTVLFVWPLPGLLRKLKPLVNIYIAIENCHL